MMSQVMEDYNSGGSRKKSEEQVEQPPQVIEVVQEDLSLCSNSQKDLTNDKINHTRVTSNIGSKALLRKPIQDRVKEDMQRREEKLQKLRLELELQKHLKDPESFGSATHRPQLC